MLAGNVVWYSSTVVGVSVHNVLMMINVLLSVAASYGGMYRVETVMYLWILTLCSSILYVLMLVDMSRSMVIVLNVSE